MKKLFVVFCYFLLIPAFSQTLVIGDSTNKHVQRINASYADASVEFDFDCDGTKDLQFNTSTTKVGSGGTLYGRLGFVMALNVEVLNAGIGNVTPFNGNQTVNVNTPNLWTKNLDFIFGHGGMGNYGQTITKKYIVYRKLNPADTTYFFMEMSNNNTTLTIHKIISDCQSSLIAGEETKENLQKNEPQFYPNPFFNKVIITQKQNELVRLKIYDLQGRLKKTIISKQGEIIDLSDLAPGGYIFRSTIGKEINMKLLLKL